VIGKNKTGQTSESPVKWVTTDDMKKKKLKKKIEKLEKRLSAIESSKPKIRHIGFEYLYNHHDENEFDD